MIELRSEAMKKCEAIVEGIAKVADRLQRARESAMQCRARLVEGRPAGEVPLPSTTDAEEALAYVGRQCARLDTLITLAFDAEVQS